MPYPAIDIDLQKLAANAKQIVDACSQSHLTVMGVTKAFCADPAIAQAMLSGGVVWLGDSRIQNLARLKEAGINAPLCLLRLPMISEVEETVRLADMSQVSELETVKALSSAAARRGVTHKITLMVDLGDLREGIWPNQVLPAAKAMVHLPGIELYGLGVNMACYGGVVPTYEKLAELVALANTVRNETGISLPLVSGGNSANLHLLPEGIPSGVTQLRIGEGILLGRETINRDPIAGAFLDVFTLHTEIIELQEKPSVPIGKIGQDAFGNTPVFIDKGLRKRAIVAIGRQDVIIENLEPCDPNMTVIGGSSDHLILDVSDVSPALAVGDTVAFNLQYGALMLGMMSPYVTKRYLP